MLVPLTDPKNPYAAMMLELIEQSKSGAHSHVWESPVKGTPRRRRLSIIDRILPRRRPVVAPAI